MMEKASCPKCGSQEIEPLKAGGKTYSSGCGLAGCLFLGPLGLLLGLLGGTPDKLAFVCMSCGKEFVPPYIKRKQSVRAVLSLILLAGIVFLVIMAVNAASESAERLEREGRPPGRDRDAAGWVGDEAAAAAGGQRSQRDGGAARELRLRLSDLEKGMTKDQVLEVMGEPSRRMEGGSETRRVAWWWYGENMRLVIINGELTEWGEVEE